MLMHDVIVADADVANHRTNDGLMQSGQNMSSADAGSYMSDTEASIDDSKFPDQDQYTHH